MLDLHIWPWFERMASFKPGVNLLKDLPKLTAYKKDMEGHPTVKATLFSDEVHKKFFDGHVAGKPDYDIGLQS